MSNPSEQRKVGYKKPPVDRQFGGKNGNPRNNGGVPKRFLEIRKEIANLLDPNLTLEDYKHIYKSAETESAIRAVFAEAVIKKDIKTIFEMINQAMGRPKESVDVTSNVETLFNQAKLKVEVISSENTTIQEATDSTITS